MEAAGCWEVSQPSCCTGRQKAGHRQDGTQSSLWRACPREASPPLCPRPHSAWRSASAFFSLATFVPPPTASQQVGPGVGVRSLCLLSLGHRALSGTAWGSVSWEADVGWEGTVLAGSAQPQTLGLQKSNVCWQLHCNMYLEALEISATVRPPLPVRLEFIGNHEWVVLGPLGWLVGGWGPGLG